MSDEKQKPDISALRIDKSQRYDDRPRSKAWRYLAAAVVIVVIIISYFIFKKEIAPATSVQTATVTLITGSQAEASLVATGYVVAQRKAEVASKGTGRLEYLGFEEGDRVKANEIIAKLDNDDIQALLELAQANEMRAEADLENAQRQFRRQQGLDETGSTTTIELETAETAFKLAKAGLAAAQASTRAAQVDLDNTYIKAPFDGTILSKNADVGEIVAPFASSASSKGSVVTLADMNSLEVEADVAEANIQKVSVGQRCEIILDAYPDSPYPGFVKKIVPTADRSRATVLTKVAFEQKDSRVLPEMSARVNFFVNEDSARVMPTGEVLGIPGDAVTNRDGRKVVFRIDGEYVDEVEVTLGRKLGKVTEVLSGLSRGDRLVLSPPGKMKTGQKVETSP